LRWFGGNASSLVTIGSLALICTLLGLSWASVNPIIDEISRIESSRLPRLELIEKVKYADLSASVALRNILLVKDGNLDKAELQRFTQSSQIAAAALEAFEASTSKTPQEMELTQTMLTARRALTDMRDRAIEFDKLGGTASETDSLTVQLQDTLEIYLVALQRLYDYQAARVTSLIDAMAARASKVRLLLFASGLISAVSMLFLASSWRSEMRRQVTERDRQIASLKTQRDALVREVHHRIKNHLQGLLGLFESHRSAKDHADSDVRLSTLHGHVLGLVGSHGLQARDSSESIPLKDLVRRQVELVRTGFPGAQVAVLDDANLESATLSADQAVPVALAVTELIVNAIKHGAAAPVRVSIGTHEQRPCVSIANRLDAPTKLDWAEQRGLGTGLSLVATLLLGIGRLSQQMTSEDLIMTVELIFSADRPMT
jgi:two-component sensor histidine kinase